MVGGKRLEESLIREEKCLGRLVLGWGELLQIRGWRREENTKERLVGKYSEEGLRALEGELTMARKKKKVTSSKTGDKWTVNNTGILTLKKKKKDARDTQYLNSKLGSDVTFWETVRIKWVGLGSWKGWPSPNKECKRELDGWMKKMTKQPRAPPRVC